MTDVRPPDAVPPAAHAAERRRPSPVPQSFQTRLTFAFMAVVALTLTLVAPILVLRLDAYFREQEEIRLQARADATAELLARSIVNAHGTHDPVVIVNPATGEATVAPEVDALVRGGLLQEIANMVAQADVEVRFGPADRGTDGQIFPDPDPDLVYRAGPTVELPPGQVQDPGIPGVTRLAGRGSDAGDWGVSATLTNPYTFRASTLAAINGLLLLMAAAAFAIAVLVAAFLAHRFSVPISRLTYTARRLADGHLGARVPTDELSSGTLELRELSMQFNQMADRLEESVAIIRRDRDRSRDFLADVSHELRTPIAAMRTFVELLQGPAGLDTAARAEFLDSSATQLDRLDWLAQNLLELSKLDSGLVLLDLRPDDVRGTIESAVEQQQAFAERKGVGLTVVLPDRPLRIRHDAPRVGQVVANLVGNAVKFTNRGGTVTVSARADADGDARIEVLDTGVGIPEAELPLVFDRFYRGTELNEARSTGSGLGLSIVKSIVDMHHGSIVVESRVGRGTRFVVTLPKDPREVVDVAPTDPDEPPSERAATGPVKALVVPEPAKVDDSSPSADSPVNRPDATLSQTAGPEAVAMPQSRERSHPPA